VTKLDLRLKRLREGMARLAPRQVSISSSLHRLIISAFDIENIPTVWIDNRILNWCATWAAGIRRHSQTNRLIFSQHRLGRHQPDAFARNCFSAADLSFSSNTIHWIKSIAIDNRTFGNFKPISSKRFLNDCHEYIFHFTRQVGWRSTGSHSAFLPGQKQHCLRWSHTCGDAISRLPRQHLVIPYQTIQSRAKARPHPATFPVQLAEWCTKLHAAPRVPHHARSVSRNRKILPSLRRNAA